LARDVIGRQQQITLTKTEQIQKILKIFQIPALLKTIADYMGLKDLKFKI